MVEQTLDQSKVETFVGKMVSVLNGGSLALMTSIGHRVELFDTMAGMEAGIPISSASSVCPTCASITCLRIRDTKRFSWTPIVGTTALSTR